jgi:hypothetical protein
MMRRLLVVSILLSAVLISTGALVVGQSKVPPQAIASSVTRTPELLERAWRLPVVATFGRQVAWQSNASLCGPASVGNVYRSLGDRANTEDKVLAGTGRCWTGFCIIGLTLDELVVNFTRKAIFGAGGGHHSPLGGYLEPEDLVLVLDVNRDFQAWLVERTRLFAAVNTFDGETKRGLLLIE